MTQRLATPSAALPARPPTFADWNSVVTEFLLAPVACLDDREWLRARVDQWLAHVGLAAELRLSHQFQPLGVSLYWLGPELSVAIHTWPEHGGLTLDISAPHAPAALLQSCQHALREAAQRRW